MSVTPRLGVIGIGLMGEAMVERLLSLGYPVTVWNRPEDMRERVARVIARGAVGAETPAALAGAVDLILVCVLHDKAVEACVFGEHGVVHGARAGQVLVDHSTISPTATREFAARLREHCGCGWVDAPVSGGPPGARDGVLAIMAGGEKAHVKQAQPVLDALGGNVNHVGPVASGQTVKIVNQLICGINFVQLAEAAALTEAAGLNAPGLPDWLAGGYADGEMLRRVYPRMVAREFEPPAGLVSQMLKDLEAVLRQAQELGLSLPLAETATERYRQLVADGASKRDTTAVLELYRPAGSRSG